MTTPPSPPTPADADTFEVRWDRWIAKGIRRDEVQHGRAMSALVVIASTIALVAAWAFALR